MNKLITDIVHSYRVSDPECCSGLEVYCGVRRSQGAVTFVGTRAGVLVIVHVHQKIMDMIYCYSSCEAWPNDLSMILSTIVFCCI